MVLAEVNPKDDEILREFVIYELWREMSGQVYSQEKASPRCTVHIRPGNLAVILFGD